jgi:hypothetical protein
MSVNPYLEQRDVTKVTRQEWAARLRTVFPQIGKTFFERVKEDVPQHTVVYEVTDKDDRVIAQAVYRRRTPPSYWLRIPSALGGAEGAGG